MIYEVQEMYFGIIDSSFSYSSILISHIISVIIAHDCARIALEGRGSNMSREPYQHPFIVIMAEEEVAIIFDVSDTNTFFIQKIQEATITRIRKHQKSR